MIVSRLRQVLRAAGGRAGYIELLVESGLDRGGLDAALDFWRRRGNVAAIEACEPGFGTAQPACGGRCSGCGASRVRRPRPEGKAGRVVYEWRDAANGCL